MKADYSAQGGEEIMKNESTKSNFGLVRSGLVFLALVAFALLVFSLRARPIQAGNMPAGASALLPMAKPEEEGFSTERLQRVHDAMQRQIDAGKIAGVVTLIAHNGKIVEFDPQGWADLDTKRPMVKDNVFNWASLSKTITAVAVMMMVEEGKIQLRDPVWRYIPEFKDQKVRVAGSSDLVKANHDITIRDLLTHTSGIMGGGPGSNAPNPNELLTSTLAVMVPRFAAVPLAFQPGTKWAYSGWAGFDTLGRIVEIVSGKPYNVFLKERIFDPLGMKDTGFNPFADARAPRLAIRYTSSPNVYEPDPNRPAEGSLKKLDPPTPYSVGNAYFSGAAGLSGTAEDYARFAQMLLNGGEFNGKRLLSPETITMMRGNHVGDLFPGFQGTYPREGTGFGLGVQVVVDRSAGDILLPDGSFGWVGASGCEGVMIPKENIALVFMVGGGDNLAARTEFHTTAMQAFMQ
jgi:CubicO group peptidase (beta-lactamase class C family)